MTRAELRQQISLMRKEARARLEKLPAVQRARERRRKIRRAVGLAIIAILLCFLRCDCGEGPPAPVQKIEAKPPVVKPPPKAVVRPIPKKPLDGQAEKIRRGNLGIAGPASPTWIDEFQLQVAARSPRLAQCFTGIDRPGALRWAASVNPPSGAVSDHEFELVGATFDLVAEQRDCLIRVLSNPVYRLTAKKDEALPNRVSLVIEF